MLHAQPKRADRQRVFRWRYSQDIPVLSPMEPSASHNQKVATFLPETSSTDSKDRGRSAIHTDRCAQTSAKRNVKTIGGLARLPWERDRESLKGSYRSRYVRLSPCLPRPHWQPYSFGGRWERSSESKSVSRPNARVCLLFKLPGQFRDGIGVQDPFLNQKLNHGLDQERVGQSEPPETGTPSGSLEISVHGELGANSIAVTGWISIHLPWFVS